MRDGQIILHPSAGGGVHMKTRIAMPAILLLAPSASLEGTIRRW